jgi:hypothetical protein
MSKMRAVSAVLSATLALSTLFGGTAFATGQADPPGVSASQAAALTALPCSPSGPSGLDGLTGSALNPQLANQMRGHMNEYNVSCARAVVRTVKNRGLNERAAAIAIATVIVETSIANLDGGDLDSVGLFQQRATWGSFAQRTDPVYATSKFLDVMQSFYPNNSWNTAPIGDVAADVQRPAAEYRYRYGVQANDAVIIARMLWNQPTFGREEVGVYRASEGRFHLRDYNGQLFYVPWGAAGDVPVTGDWNGDGRQEIGVYRASEGRFHLRDHNGTLFYVPWGAAGDIPVTGDWNGDGRYEVGIYRPSEGRFHLRDHNGQLFYVNWGGPGDVPVTGDWNGDGRFEVGVYRASEGRFHLRDHNGQLFYVNWGGVGDIPVTGDWNGDGKFEVGVYRASEGRFHLRDHNAQLFYVNWGGAGDIPVPGDWNGA